MVDRYCINRYRFISQLLDIAQYMGYFIAIRSSIFMEGKRVSSFQSIPMFGLTANIISGSPCIRRAPYPLNVAVIYHR
jgi:hypothetical protein